MSLAPKACRGEVELLGSSRVLKEDRLGKPRQSHRPPSPLFSISGRHRQIPPPKTILNIPQPAKTPQEDPPTAERRQRLFSFPFSASLLSVSGTKTLRPASQALEGFNIYIYIYVGLYHMYTDIYIYIYVDMVRVVRACGLR